MTTARSDSYYGQPIVREPVWKPAIAIYLWTGGLAGASATLAAAARRSGDDRLARAANIVAATAVNASPALLIYDLGRRRRFLNMLRVFKPTSPMSVGSWLLAGSGTAMTASAALDVLDVLPRLQRAAETVAAALGPPLATYTAVLLSDTAIPAWHEARHELPALFAASAAASAGAAALVVPGGDTRASRRLMVVGALAEASLAERMVQRLGALGAPYRTGTAGRWQRAATASSLAGAALGTLGRRRPAIRRLAAPLVLAGALAQRLAVFHAGTASARDPASVVEPQRRRLAERERV